MFEYRTASAGSSQSTYAVNGGHPGPGPVASSRPMAGPPGPSPQRSPQSFTKPNPSSTADRYAHINTIPFTECDL